MKIIALEEHFSLPDISSRIDKKIIAARGWPTPDHEPPVMKKATALLSEIGPKRLQSMDEAGISIQVLSMAGPGADLLSVAESIAFARDYNNGLAEKIAAHPQRFAGFAHLPMTAPEAAADELERAVKELGFCGAMINGMTDNLFLDDKHFAPILAKAEKLDVPLYLHPAFPPPEIQKLYYARLPQAVGSVLASAAFGWHAEVAIHILRLIASGTLDQYPKLQLIIGHMGEMLPFMMYRSEAILSKEITGSARTVSEVLRSQVNITTSGIFTIPPLMVALETFGIDRILFSVDYPYAENEQGQQFLRSLPLKSEQLNQIAHGNAERLLKIK
jgi:predicted TIM-barrel fold metal-dependent hydrolase